MATSAIYTPIGLMCFPALFEARAATQGGDPRFSLILVFDQVAMKTPAYADLRKGVMNAISEKWGAAKAADAAFVRGLRLPFRATAEKEYTGFDKGEVYISPWSKNAPGVVDVQNNRIVVPTEVWAGQLARATVRPFAYDSNGNRGVSFGLEHVQIVKADMPRIDGRRSAESAFGNAGLDSSQVAALGIDPNASSAGATGLPGGDDLPF